MSDLLFILAGLMAGLAGCVGPSGAPEKVWGRRGVQAGDFVRPRAIAIHQDELYVVDFTARVQRYNLDGQYAGLTFQTPDYRNGRPSGLSIDRAGRLIVCDSHYHRVRVYDAAGAEVRSFGGPDLFGYVSDAIEDEDGSWFVSEFGAHERISKVDPAGQLILRFGEPGDQPGQLNRARALAIGPDGLLYVADACNHRIQVFDRQGRYVRHFGESGELAGQLSYPYDLAFNSKGELFVAERGNHRVQKFSTTGLSLGTWGTPGRQPGQLSNPWALAVDRFDRVHVVDTENHRIQRIRIGG